MIQRVQTSCTAEKDVSMVILFLIDNWQIFEKAFHDKESQEDIQNFHPLLFVDTHYLWKNNV